MKSVAAVVCVVFMVVFVGSVFAAPVVKHPASHTSNTAPAKTKAVATRTSTTAKTPVATTAKKHPRHHKRVANAKPAAPATKSVKPVCKAPSAAKPAASAAKPATTKAATGGAKSAVKGPHSSK